MLVIWSVGSGFGARGQAPVAAGKWMPLGMALLGWRAAWTEVEGLWVQRTERELVAELVGEDQESTGRVCLWRIRQVVDRGQPVL
jgi:hypothetical protein